jgi:hypothetical protein
MVDHIVDASERRGRIDIRTGVGRRVRLPGGALVGRDSNAVSTRHKLRRLALGSRHRFARLAAPREHLLRRQPMPARNVGNHGARNKRLRNDPRLEIIREMAPPARSGKHFQPANFRHLRLKLMVKSSVDTSRSPNRDRTIANHPLA